MRRVIVILVFAVLAANHAVAGEYTSPWVDSLSIPTKSRKMLDARIEKWQYRRSFESAMRRMAHLKPVVDDYCAREGIDPEPLYGLILTESQARPMAVDGVFKSGRSRKAHVGLGQLNYKRLPCNTPGRVKAALEWRQSGDPEDFQEWKELDKRFDPRWNLRVTIHEFHGHMERTGDPTLAFMGHHGGGNDPVRAVILYARDHGVKLSRQRVPAYVQRHNLDYFMLFEYAGSARQYWANKSDNHLMYGFAPVVWSELFARWCEQNGIENKPPVMATKIAAKPQKEALKVHSMIEFLAAFARQFAGEANVFWAAAMPFIRDLAILIFVSVAAVKLAVEIFHGLWMNKLFIPWVLKNGLPAFGRFLKAFGRILLPRKLRGGRKPVSA